jgi:hypothetical protein
LDYLDDLGRAGSKAELDGLATLLNGSTAAQAFVADHNARGPETYDRLVKSWYLNYLGRAANRRRRARLGNQLLVGSTEESVLNGILSSGEFFHRAQTPVLSGSAVERYVDDLYLLLLGREADPGEAAWLFALPLARTQQMGAPTSNGTSM